MAAGLAKTATWLIRLLQLFFSLILVGIVSYMIHEFREVHFKVPNLLILPEVAVRSPVPHRPFWSSPANMILQSVLALFISVFSIIAVCFLNHTLQLVAAFLDFAAFVLYIASAALLRHNFHDNSDRNPLRNSLIWMGQRVSLTNGLVKMLVAGVVIQIILFFITTLLGVYVARRGDPNVSRSRRGRHAV